MIFSISLKEYLKYLRFIFSIFIKINIYLLLKKLFLDYFFMQLFDQKVDILKLIIIKDKFIIIINLYFSKTFD